MDVIKKQETYGYLAEIYGLAAILLGEYKKFKIDSMKERVGVVVIGMLLWFMVGLASEAVLVKGRKRSKVEEKLAKESKQNEQDEERGRGDQFAFVDEDDEIEDEDIRKKQERLELEKRLQKDIDELQTKIKLHLRHCHGGPFRDFTIYCTLVIFFWKYSGGCLDEANGESSLCFQMWQYLRKLIKKRTPMPEIVKIHDQRQMVRHMCPSTRKRKSTYIEDSRNIMVDIRVDASMMNLSPRLYDAWIRMVSVMDDFWQRRNYDFTISNFVDFYEDGSFVVKCGSDENANEYIDLSFKKGVCVTGQKCSYDEWLPIAHNLAQRAAKRNLKNPKGFHCRKPPKT